MNLQAKYNELNRRHWKGQLPKVKVEWSDNRPKSSLVSTHLHGMGRCHPRFCDRNCKKSWIRFDPRLKEMQAWAVVEMSLMHEMVHVEALLGNKLLATHGPTWQRRMKQLAERGAFNSVW